MRNTLTGEGFR